MAVSNQKKTLTNKTSFVFLFFISHIIVTRAWPANIIKTNVNIGETCPTASDEECTIPESFCYVPSPENPNDPLSKTCQCNPRFYASKDQLECLPIEEPTKISDPCNLNTECLVVDTNSYCGTPNDEIIDRACECNPGFMASADKNICLVLPYLVDETCTSQIECTNIPDSSCVLRDGDTEATCQCNSGFQPASDKTACISIINLLNLIDDPCTSSTECANIANSECVLKEGEAGTTCQCKPDFEASPDKTTCVPIIDLPDLIGEVCTADTPCTNIDNSECVVKAGDTETTCQCSAGFEASPENDKCNPIIDLPDLIGEVCTADTPCTNIDNSECVVKAGDIETTCQCSAGFEASPENDKCNPIIDLPDLIGEVCTADTPCTNIDNSECVVKAGDIETTCQCSAGFEASPEKDKCIAIIDIPDLINEKCSLEAPCTNIPDAICVVKDGDTETTCQCSAEHFAALDLSKCLINPSNIGDGCSEISQCQDIDKYTMCGTPDAVNGTCVCDNDHTASDSKDTCWANEVLLPCNNDLQCQGLLGPSFCNAPTPDKGRCECLPGSAPSESLVKCLMYATQVGDPCEERKQCQLLGESYVDCVFPEDGSTEAFCLCNNDSVVSSGGEKCLPILSHGNECADIVQCPQPNTDCIPDVDGKDKCLCVLGFIFDGQECIPSGLESFICNSSTECSYIPGSDCLPSAEDPLTKCRCIENFIPTSDPIKVKCLPLAFIIGEPCEEVVQCQRLGGTECKSADEWSDPTCQCKANLHPDPTNTRCLENIPE